jgi:hypothetical protein
MGLQGAEPALVANVFRHAALRDGDDSCGRCVTLSLGGPFTRFKVLNEVRGAETVIVIV